MSHGIRITAEEQARRDACAVEPIRTPGAVQPHGVLLAVSADSLDIVHASSNARALLGIAAEDLLGTSITSVIDFAPLAAVLDVAARAANPTLVSIGERQFDAIVHAVDGLVIVDLEPVIDDVDVDSTAVLYAAIHDLSRVTTAPELWAHTARAVRQITRFDHVMVYHFHPDEHGEVVGEDLAEGMESYLGLHYPASDIPQQARELYLSKLSRVIATTAEQPAELLSLGDSESALLVDLSGSELRSVSPRHLEFMRNMGQASTMSFSLINEGRLIGMITCAHRTPRRLPYSVRQGLEILANQVALQLGSIASIAQLTRRAQIRAVRASIVAGLAGVDVADALLHAETPITELIAADGAAVRLGGVVQRVGTTPSLGEMSALSAALLATESGLSFVSDALPIDHPALAALVPDVAGLLVVPLGGEGDYIAWFRNELVRSISWLGDQSPSNRETPLSPRNSFSSWSQDVTGTSASWDGLEVDAAELARDVDSVLFRRAESQLAQLALIDPLTGLPNRRLLMDRIEHALTRAERGEQLALLFLDLDGFKAVNDSAGHLEGDKLLERTARQLLATARAQDTVARIGGDEFVVLCEGTSVEQAEVLAARIIAAVGADGSGVTASVGIAAAEPGVDASTLLSRADSAMYRAKQGGRNQFAR